MEPIYQFATPKSVAQLKVELENESTITSQNTGHVTTSCCKQVQEKSQAGATPVLALAFLLLTSLFLSTASWAQAVTPQALAYKSILSAKTAPATTGKGLDGIHFPEAEFKRGAYLKMRTVYLQVPVSRFKIKPFPANSSVETRAELDFLLQLQQNRTAEEIARTKVMANIYFDPLTTNPADPDYTRNINSLFYIGRDLGPWFTPEKLPVTARVLQNVIQDATYYFFSLKADFNRARPYHLEPRLQPLEAPGHASYPSGHSSSSHVHAYLLSHIFPAYADHFLGVASEMASSRETRGVHYPSDTEAGKEFARQFVEELLKNRKFRTDFEAMKAEITQVGMAHKLTRN